MARLNKILCRLALLLFVFGLGGCGYGSYPGIVVETQEYPLDGKAKLIVTRHLDGWKTGSLFSFEWYVVKCQSNSGNETVLSKEFVPRGTFSNEIPKERIQITDGKIGYAYFGNIVVFDKQCNKISYLYYGDFVRLADIESVVLESGIPESVLLESVVIDKSGLGTARLVWHEKNNTPHDLLIETNDFGVHWTLPNSEMDVREELKIELPQINIPENFTEKLAKSEYMIKGGKLTRRTSGTVSTQTSLNQSDEFKILKNSFYVARARRMIRDDVGVIIINGKEHYEIIFGNPASLSKLGPTFAYAAKVTVNKKSHVLAQWLSGYNVTGDRQSFSGQIIQEQLPNKLSNPNNK